MTLRLHQRTPLRYLTVACIIATMALTLPIPAEAQPRIAPTIDDSTSSPNLMDLISFRGWFLGLPGIDSSGYYGSADDISTRGMTLMWHGESSLKSQIAKTAKERNITLNFEPITYTRQMIGAAAHYLLDKRNSRGALRGFVAKSVSGPTSKDSRIRLVGRYSSGSISNEAEQNSTNEAVAGAIKARFGLDAIVQIGDAGIPYTTRSTDTSPFNAGGMMDGDDGGPCSSGFAINLGGYSYTTTAFHCTSSSYWSWDRWEVPGYLYGSSQTVDLQTGTRVLDGRGFPWLFDGAWNEPTGRHLVVRGIANVGETDPVCTSGGNSGTHCGMKVTDLADWWNDGYQDLETIVASRPFNGPSNVSATEGDSGGAVFVGPIANIQAVGVLQGSGPGTEYSGVRDCGTTRIPNSYCASSVRFTSEQVFLNNIHASLRTG